MPILRGGISCYGCGGKEHKSQIEVPSGIMVIQLSMVLKYRIAFFSFLEAAAGGTKLDHLSPMRPRIYP